MESIKIKVSLNRELDSDPKKYLYFLTVLPYYRKLYSQMIQQMI